MNVNPIVKETVVILMELKNDQQQPFDVSPAFYH